MEQSVGTDSLTSSFFPILGYSSDIGLLGGGVYSRFDYRGDTEPFRTHWQSLAAISTKGFIKVEAQFEQTGSFGTDLRSDLNLFIDRLAYDNYFGVGNRTTYSDQLWENDFYFFESLSIGFTADVRETLYRSGATKFDWLLGLGTEYEIPHTKQQNSLFNQVRPLGFSGGWVNFLKTGLLWENRNNEFDPTRGNRAELSIRYAPSFLLSDYEMAVVNADLRQYVKLFHTITVAGRARVRHATGDVPYWELSALGEDNSLRGYPRNRFLGKSSVEYNLELRTWVLEFPAYQIKLGGQLFTDVGRVFTAGDDLGDLFEGYKQTFGFGGAISLFNPDVILRGEIGFSDNGSQIYIGAGYMF